MKVLGYLIANVNSRIREATAETKLSIFSNNKLTSKTIDKVGRTFVREKQEIRNSSKEFECAVFVGKLKKKKNGSSHNATSFSLSNWTFIFIHKITNFKK